jgi:hypothetical protein
VEAVNAPVGRFGTAASTKRRIELRHKRDNHADTPVLRFASNAQRLTVGPTGGDSTLRVDGLKVPAERFPMSTKNRGWTSNERQID